MSPIRTLALAGAILTMSLAGALPAAAHHREGHSRAAEVQSGRQAPNETKREAHAEKKEAQTEEKEPRHEARAKAKEAKREAKAERKASRGETDAEDQETRREARPENKVRGERDEVRGRSVNGEITAIAGSVWTVDRAGSRGIVQVDVADAKVRWPGDRDATLADFSVGDRVNVKLEREGTERDERVTTTTPTTTTAPTATPTTTTVLEARAVHFVPAGGRGKQEAQVTRD